ncbi:MAG: GIY-YIG nuclease family protein [bacterium]|nr:GIY-YIG nuclease family protein [bacterium]
MWYVYILKDKENTIYIGSTNDLKRRMAEHKANKCYTTKQMKEIELETYIAVKKENTARKLEKYLKGGSGKAFLKKRLLSDEVSTKSDLSSSARLR